MTLSPIRPPQLLLPAGTVEDRLVEDVARRAASLISPVRKSLRVLLARSDDVQTLNALAEQRR